jgi:hypothetical protein
VKRAWPRWDQVFVIVKPETLVAWQRFSLVLDVARPSWQARPAEHPQEIRDLIRMISRNNPHLGCDRLFIENSINSNHSRSIPIF